MSREHPSHEEYAGAAHADTPENTELEELKLNNAVARVTSKLEELGVQDEWEKETAKPGRTIELPKDSTEQLVRGLLIGQSFEGVTSDGTRWKVERLGPTDYEVTTEDQEEE